MIASGAGSEINFTSTTDYRSFTYSIILVRAATLQAFQRMQIVLLKDENHGDRVTITGKTKSLTINIALIPVTPAVTKAAVNAKKNWLKKDQTVAAEILFQIAQILDRADSASTAVKAARPHQDGGISK